VIDDERQLMNLITQSQVVRFLQQNMHLLGDKRLTPVKEIQGVMHEVFSVNIHQRAIDAFHEMVDKGVTGVAIVDNSGRLRGNLSLRDLKAMSTDGRFFWRLYQTVENYIIKLKQDIKGTAYFLPHYSPLLTTHYAFVSTQRAKGLRGCRSARSRTRSST
jgi:predicted transcriptional regulator